MYGCPIHCPRYCQSNEAPLSLWKPPTGDPHVNAPQIRTLCILIGHIRVDVLLLEGSRYLPWIFAKQKSTKLPLATTLNSKFQDRQDNDLRSLLVVHVAHVGQEALSNSCEGNRGEADIDRLGEGHEALRPRLWGREVQRIVPRDV
jgi:hypothetical protein